MEIPAYRYTNMDQAVAIAAKKFEALTGEELA